MKELAATCPNVVIKVGCLTHPPPDGVAVPSSWRFTKRDGRKVPIGSEELARLMLPFYGHAIDCFGTSRCMFESNFPVDKDCVSYRVLWNAFKRIAARKGMSATEKRDIFHDTAARVYKLEPIGPSSSL